jgi:hypothetical protein
MLQNRGSADIFLTHTQHSLFILRREKDIDVKNRGLADIFLSHPQHSLFILRREREIDVTE